MSKKESNPPPVGVIRPKAPPAPPRKRVIATYVYPTYGRPLRPPLEGVEVVVMARADGYAMVRRKGCMPFVAKETDLRGVEV